MPIRSLQRGEETPVLNTLRISLLGGVAALGVASVAVADMSGLFGNTIVAFDRRNPEIVVKTQLNADGTYQAWVSGNLGKPVTTQGTWNEQDGKLCYTQTSPPIPGRPIHFCIHDMDGKKVGDTWIDRWEDGGTYKSRVVAGSN
jgi:hypothetical protein